MTARIVTPRRQTGVGDALAPPRVMSAPYLGPERRHESPGRRAVDREHEQERLDMRNEIARLKAVVEILADAVHALTAAQHRPPPARTDEAA